MRFNLTDWSLLVLVSAIAFAISSTARHVVLGFLDFPMAIYLMHMPLLLATTWLVFDLLYPLASWLILRRRIDELRLTRWLLASVLGFALSLTALWLLAWLPPRSLATVHLLLPGRLSAVEVLLVWLTAIAASFAYYLPPGLLLQRLSATSAWPFIIGGAAATLANMLIRLTGGLAVDLVSGAIHGLGAGAGLFLMARRPAVSGADGDLRRA